MSDEHLRALERSCRESGGIEEEAAHLAARLRAGVLDEQRVAFAAALGDAAATRALGLRGSSSGSWRLSRSTLEANGPWPGDAAIAAGIEIVVLLRERCALENDGLAPTLAATWQCLDQPSEEAAQRVDLLVEELWGPEPDGRRLQGLERALSFLVGSVGRKASELARGHGLEPWARWVRAWAGTASRVHPEAAVWAAVVRGACRRLLARGPGPAIEAVAGRLPAQPPIEVSLEELRSNLRWCQEHLAHFERLRGVRDPLWEQELGYLVNAAGDVEREADRLREIVDKWAQARRKNRGAG